MNGDVEWSLALLRRSEPGGADLRPLERPDERGGGPRIRCPRCGWEPRQADRWSCTCGCVWNTFETRGVCPECGHAWRDTQCLYCFQWSRHEDWYVAEEDTPGAA